jgi:hypothetical protein
MPTISLGRRWRNSRDVKPPQEWATVTNGGAIPAFLRTASRSDATDAAVIASGASGGLSLCPRPERSYCTHQAKGFMSHCKMFHSNKEAPRPCMRMTIGSLGLQSWPETERCSLWVLMETRLDFSPCSQSWLNSAGMMIGLLTMEFSNMKIKQVKRNLWLSIG